MKYEYLPRGVCSRKIEIDLSDDGIIRSVKFTGGCNGNANGISRLLVGMKAQDAIDRMKGTVCGSKKTSCPDQLSIALQQALDSRGA
ncbi:MAG: TIGR03905 family protein [Oscillospiraceae bacterium]|nr:MAG: TIGR03905 family protein [Oscillospiraceae bacterium]